MAGHVLAVDIGGTHMRTAVVDRHGGILERQRQETPRDEPQPDTLVAMMRDGAEKHGLQRAVVGLPGRVNYPDGVLEYAPHLPQGWLPHLTRHGLAERTGLHMHICNDAELASAGEAEFGAGRGYVDVTYLTISTGIGAGVVLDGKVAHGVRSMPEPGHTIVDLTALEEGRPATLEDFASGTALGEWARAGGLGENASALLDLLEKGDPRAMEIWSRSLRMIQAAVFNLAMLFSPEVVVIGGGVGLNAKGLVEDIREWLADHPVPGLPNVRVERAALGDDAGLAGAAAWVRMFGPGG